MDGPGTITWEEFLHDAKSLLDVSNKISDRWELHGDEETPGQVYLSRTTRSFISKELSDQLLRKSTYEYPTGGDDIEDPFESNQTKESPMVVEHHVLWSMSYGVPVLYFNAWISDYPGVNPVSVEAIQDVIQQGVGYNEISQAIHPIIGKPFLHFHPCMSKELLQSTSKSNNKLISWLSIVAPSALYLKLSSEYFKLTFGEAPSVNSPASHLVNEEVQ